MLRLRLYWEGNLPRLHNGGHVDVYDRVCGALQPRLFSPRYDTSNMATPEKHQVGCRAGAERYLRLHNNLLRA